MYALASVLCTLLNFLITPTTPPNASASFFTLFPCGMPHRGNHPSGTDAPCLMSDPHTKILCEYAGTSNPLPNRPTNQSVHAETTVQYAAATATAPAATHARTYGTWHTAHTLCKSAVANSLNIHALRAALHTLWGPVEWRSAKKFEEERCRHRRCWLWWWWWLMVMVPRGAANVSLQSQTNETQGVGAM